MYLSERWLVCCVSMSKGVRPSSSTQARYEMTGRSRGRGLKYGGSTCRVGLKDNESIWIE